MTEQLSRITTQAVRSLVELLDTTADITDALFFNTAGVLLELFSTRHVHSHKITTNLLAGNLMTDISVETQARNLLEELSNLETRIETLLFQRVHDMTSSTTTTTTTSPPRIVRLASLLHLSSQELRALIFLQLMGTGVHGDDEFNKANVLEKLRLFARMDTADIFHFLSPRRLHMKENLIELSEDEFGGDFSQVSLRLPREVLLVLSGCDVTSEDLLKLEGTTILDVLPASGTSSGGTDATSTYSNSDQEFDEESKKTVNSLEKTEEEETLKALGDMDEDALFDMLQDDGNNNDDNDDQLSSVVTSSGSSKSSVASNAAEPTLNSPYENDLEYLDDIFKEISFKIKKYMLNLESEGNDSYNIMTRKSPEAIGREYDAKERKARLRWEKRTAVTLRRGRGKEKEKEQFIPKAERLAELLSLTTMEKYIVLSLVGVVISQEMKRAMSGSSGGRASSVAMGGNIDIGTLIGVHCTTLSEQIHARRWFYKKSSLVKTGIIHVHERNRYGGGVAGFGGDLTACTVSVDRRMLDWILGLETEIGELVEGGSCYTPMVELDQVILQDETKNLLLETLCDYDAFLSMQKRAGLKTLMPTGRGLIVLFHGVPGTGKTMCANALANYLKKKILSVDLPHFSRDLSSESFKMLFREAKLQNAVIFLDECEPMFESRDRKSNGMVNVALTALDTFEGIMFLATNRPFDLDEAMMRRITLSVEFTFPSALQRELIWKAHVPASGEDVVVSDEVDWGEIAREFELNGGYVKNAMLQAFKFAASRELKTRREKEQIRKEEKKEAGNIQDDLLAPSELICVSKDDVVRACRLQVRGRLQAAGESSMMDATELKARNSEEISFSSLVYDANMMQQLEEIVANERQIRTLGHEWGFDKSEHFFGLEHGGRRIVFRGQHGVGKTFAARAVAFESGRPLRRLSWPDLLRTKMRSSPSSSLSSSSRATTVESILRGARNSRSILLLEECESLFNGYCLSSSVSSIVQSAAESVLYTMSSHPGTIIFCVSTPDSISSSRFVSEMDGRQLWDPNEQQMPRVVSAIVSTSITFQAPTAEERTRLWRKLIPSRTPIDVDVDFDLLGTKFVVVGKSIRACVLKASGAALRRENQKERVLKMSDLVEAVEEVVASEQFRSRNMRDLYV